MVILLVDTNIENIGTIVTHLKGVAKEIIPAFDAGEICEVIRGEEKKINDVDLAIVNVKWPFARVQDLIRALTEKNGGIRFFLVSGTIKEEDLKIFTATKP